jgi:hypothetical protein
VGQNIEVIAENEEKQTEGGKAERKEKIKSKEEDVRRTET